MSSNLRKSQKYDNLFRSTASGTFFYRKYSKVKGKQFSASTGEKENEARAYKLGVEAFNEWLGKMTDEQGVIYFSRFARRYLNAKLDNPKFAIKTKRRFQGEFEASLHSSESEERYRPRLFDAFGHLPLEKITNEVWEAWMASIAKDFPEFHFFNARKALLEVLNYAHENGYLNRVPKLTLQDPEAAPPRELTKDEIRKLFAAAHPVQMVGHTKATMRKQLDKNGLPVRRKHWIKLLMLIIWKQGARPGEILQYEWAMIRFEEGGQGKIDIPARITKTRRPRSILLNREVSRVLRFLRKRAPEAVFLFPSEEKPGFPIGDYQNVWKRVCGRAGLKAQIYWYRDTFVSRKLNEGVSTMWIAKYLDTSVGMLEQKYAVMGQEAQEKVAR